MFPMFAVTRQFLQAAGRAAVICERLVNRGDCIMDAHVIHIPTMQCGPWLTSSARRAVRIPEAAAITMTAQASREVRNGSRADVRDAIDS